jgi:hypothetical protein
MLTLISFLPYAPILCLGGRRYLLSPSDRILTIG